MPSEVIQRENKVNPQVKELVDTKATTKENGSEPAVTDDKVLKNDKFEEVNFSEETKADSEVQIKDKSEDSNGSEESSESENKENKEPSDDDQEIKKRAEELLVDGKRHLAINDYQAAADVLSEACSLFGTVYGDMAEECAEAYFKYGCALLELSKDQMSLVGLEEKDEGQEEEDVTEINVSSEKEKMTVSEKKNEVEQQLIEINEVKMCIDKKKLNEFEEESTEEKSTEEKETEKIEKSADDENPDEDENLDEDENPDKDENPDDKDIEEDVNDLQLAWEMLDLAKVIYKNKDTEESKLKLAEVLMKCGEVSIEDENFETAIDDMTESLQIRRLLLPEDSRIIAETLFQLGLTQEMSGSGTQAIELLTEAVAVLEQRIKTLEILSDEKTKEVAEIKTIIPEIKEKIVDIKERKQATISALMGAMGAASSEATNGSSTTKQVSNISHLVRKRPKQEETDSSVPNKVPKVEEPSTAAEQ